MDWYYHFSLEYHFLYNSFEYNNKEDEDSSKEVYLIDTETLDLSICFEEDIIARLNSGELIYEKEKHKLSGIDKEVVEWLN